MAEKKTSNLVFLREVSVKELVYLANKIGVSEREVIELIIHTLYTLMNSSKSDEVKQKMLKLYNNDHYKKKYRN